jgi:hypothetical protein
MNGNRVNVLARMTATACLTTGLVVAGCGDGAGPSPAAPVSIRFSAGAATAGAARFRLFGESGASELVITGTNGTLRITDIRVIVDEFELERTETVDCDVEPEPAGCADFEQRFLFVDVPVVGEQPVTVATGVIPAGTYEGLEFEVEDLETDADSPEDAADAALAQALLTTIRQTFTDWPDKASMVVVGTFTPTGGTATPFRVYFEAEIEVELPFLTPLTVVEGTSESFRIELSPQLWFRNADGTVRDLSLDDFTTTGRLVRFELEIEDGFDLELD